MLYLRTLFLFLLYYIIRVTGETHCRDSADCPLYPLHSCFATHSGLLCKNAREFEGFEISMNLVESFNYRPAVLHNDTGEPCQTIPLSSELESYVDFRGPQVLEIADLDLIGNCSRLTYCDKHAGNTCQPKRGIGSICQHNIQCSVGADYMPGHCNKNTSLCGLRDDIPPLYYGTALRPWSMGEHWKEAIAAVAATGVIAICFLVGRQQARKLVSGVSGLIEKWQNRDDQHYNQQQQQHGHNERHHHHQQTTTLSDEEIWNQQHVQRVWWHILPGAQMIARGLRLQHSGGTYIPLDSRPIDPPPYRGDV